MNTSDVIAIFALVISFGSLYINKIALDNAKEIQKDAEKKLIENEKINLLKQISDNKSILNKTRIEIGALRANFEIEPQPVKVIMRQFTNIFTESLPSIEDVISYLEDTYNNITNWRGEMSYSDILHTKASYHEDLKQFEISHEQAIQCIAIFKEKLKLAKEHVNGATR